MDNFHEKVKKIEELDFPYGLHGRIMRRIYLLQMRLPLAVILSFLFFNLAASAWSMWASMVEWDSLYFIKSALVEFEINTEYFSNLFETLSETLPVVPLIVFLINLLLIIYIIRISLKIQKLSPALHS